MFTEANELNDNPQWICSPLYEGKVFVIIYCARRGQKDDDDSTGTPDGVRRCVSRRECMWVDYVYLMRIFIAERLKGAQLPHSADMNERYVKLLIVE